MRIKHLNDADMLQILSVGYRMQRVLNKEYGLPPLNAAIVTLIGSYSNRASEEVLSLSVPEICALLAYSTSGKEKIYYAVKAMCVGDEALLKKQITKTTRGKKVASYSLTAKGVEIVRAAINLTKIFRHDIAQVAV